MTRQLILATGNLGKVQEFEQLLSPLGWTVSAQSQFAVPECPEPYGTFLENALAKARHAAKHTGLPSLADDSGLCVKALAGAPGVLSARYATPLGADKSDAANNSKLLTELKLIPEHARQAYFVCALVAVSHEHDPEPLIAMGRWQGRIAFDAVGEGGFGYDPLFVCERTGRSAASMSKTEKSLYSHRGLASAQLLPLLQQFWVETIL